MNVNEINIREENIAAIVNEDFKNSVFIVSLFINLAVFVTWLAVSLA